MTRKELIEQIFTKRTFLCVGLDTDIKKIPQHLLTSDDPIFEFNKAIIDATADYCVAYKPNIAFYECDGVKGWISLTSSSLMPNAATSATLPPCMPVASSKRWMWMH